MDYYYILYDEKKKSENFKYTKRLAMLYFHQKLPDSKRWSCSSKSDIHFSWLADKI
jgi:hypothetical protein